MKDEQETACELAVSRMADGLSLPNEDWIHVEIAGVRQDLVVSEAEEAAAKSGTVHVPAQ